MKTVKVQGNIMSFHPRKQHNFEQAAGLTELYPKKFKHVTSIYFPPSLVKWLGKISTRYANKIGKRSFYKLPKKFVITLPATEIKRWLMEKRHGLAHLPDYMALNEYWQKSVLRHFKPPEVCISYDGISHHLFKAWNGKSILVLDLAIGLPQYRMKIMHKDNFQMGILDQVDEVQKKLYAWYNEEVELADIILCGSDFVKQTVVYFFPEFESKCKVLPYGTDLEAFSYPERKFEQKQDFKFAFVGRLSWRKGADLMLEAWADFIIDHPKAELHFFGTADQEINLGHLAANVFMHGWVKKSILIEYLKTMDALVFPTTFEGSSIAVFQGMALKLPVITTLNSGTVLKHGESCEIIEVGDRGGLVKAMDTLMINPTYRKMLAENAYALSKKYTWNDYTKRLGKILDDVISESCVRKGRC
jgi:glycosyltransferase involved in cell wall biosynthesis